MENSILCDGYSVKFLTINRQEWWKNVTSRFHKTNTREASYRREYIASLISINNIKSVLELGCNSGANLLYISYECPNVKLTGIDINDRAIRYGKKIEGNPADLRIGSLYDLSQFKDNTFDMVFSCTTLIHVPSEKVGGIIRDMIRISKRFVLNIEDHGRKNGVCRYGDGIPHRWKTNYKKIYNNVGFKPKIYKVIKLMGKTSGGANHLIWTSKDGSILKLPEKAK